MDKELKRGVLDVCVLRAIKEKDSYGYEMVKNISEHMEISESTLYPILRRLEEKNCLIEYKTEHNGRLRKYYHITKDGLAKIEEFKNEFHELLEVYDYICEGDGIGD